MSAIKLSKSEIIENINQAFLQLDFSRKLLAYFDQNKVNKDDFDVELTWLGKFSSIVIPQNSFKTYDDLKIAAENIYSITLGFTSIVLNDALESKRGKCNRSDNSPNGKLQRLVYMIRCAYAHNMMYPKWEIKSTYISPIRIRLKHQILKLDLTKKNGQPFVFKNEIGLQNYLEIRDKVCRLIDRKWNNGGL